MKEISKVFQNNIEKEIKNNKNVFYEKKEKNIEINKVDEKNVIKKINEIFSSPNYIYKANVKITLKNETLVKKIIGRNKDYIITMDNKLIPIKDIIDIKKENS